MKFVDDDDDDDIAMRQIIITRWHGSSIV